MARYRSNKPRPELRPLLRKWEGNPAVSRDRDAPHIKTYVRYREVEGSGENGESNVSFCVGGGRASNLLIGHNARRSGCAERVKKDFGLVVLV